MTSNPPARQGLVILTGYDLFALDDDEAFALRLQYAETQEQFAGIAPPLTKDVVVSHLMARDLIQDLTQALQVSAPAKGKA